MKVVKTPQQPAFTPYDVVISVESEMEHRVLRAIAKMNISVPNRVEMEEGQAAAITSKEFLDNLYATVFDRKAK